MLQLYPQVPESPDLPRAGDCGRLRALPRHDQHGRTQAN